MVVFLLVRAAPFIARVGAGMTGLTVAGSASVAGNSRAGATLGRLSATFEGNVDKFDDLHLDAAARELAGEVVSWSQAAGRAFDHVTEVRNAMRGMRNVISGVNRLLANGRPTAEQRAVAEGLRASAIEALKKAQEAGVTPQ